MLDVDAIRADFPILATQVHGRDLVYLDNAATAQVPRRVMDAITDMYLTSNANVHRGMHALAHAATDRLEWARGRVAQFMGIADEDCVVFTRGTTDGLNMVARGLEYLIEPGDLIVTSIMEHHSSFVTWQQLAARCEARLVVIGLTPAGDIDLSELSRVLEDAARVHERVRVVALCGCSNVLGSTLNFPRAVKLAHEAGAYFVLDAAQLMRHGRIHIDEADVDFVACSGHKMCAGTGIGVLAGRRDALEVLHPRDFGGEMVGTVTIPETTWEDLPLRLEAGTPNYVGAYAMGVACEYLDSLGMDKIAAYEHELVMHALHRLSAIPGVEVLGASAQRNGVVSFVCEGVHPFDLCTMVDRYGVALRSGHNCAQPLLASLGHTSVARLSPAFYNTPDEIDVAVRAIEASLHRLSR